MKSYWNNLKDVIRMLSEKYPFLMYFLLAIIVFWPLSLGIYSLQYDAIDVYLPWRFYGSESLRQGMVPLWNPFQDGGYPFYADHQYSIWNPELFLVSLFSRFNVTILQWLFIFYISIGGLGFRFLLKQLKLDKSVWFIGGVLFMLSGIIIGHGQSMISILGAIWLPWAIGAYIKALNSDFNLKDTVGLILFMFLMLAAGYQAVSIMLFYLVLALGGYWCIDLIRKKEWKRLKKFIVGHVFTFVILGILLAGIVVSLVEVYPHLSRLSGLTLEESQLVHFHPKALGSSLFPLASVQQEFQGTSRSAQNIFSGVLSFFFLLYGLTGLKKQLNATVVILFIFGVIYGLASLGPYTPVQPFFYNFIPGCDQFYFPSFFRFFTWIALLVVVCIGLQRFLKEGSYMHIITFMTLVVVFFSVSAVVKSGAWHSVSDAFNGSWGYSFRHMGWEAGVLMQSIVHALLFIVFLLILWRWKSVKLALLFIVLELGLIGQLNLPVTVHGEIKTTTLDNYLESKKEGYLIPNNSSNIGENDAQGYYAAIWRNQGNFTNLPSLNGYSSFRLIDRQQVKVENEEMRSFLPTKPFVYLKGQSPNPIFTSFNPQHLEFKVDARNDYDTLIIQQAMYPGWTATVDNKPAEIFKVNEFEMGVHVFAGNSNVSLSFGNDKIKWLYYVSTFGFILILLIYFVQQSSISTVRNRSFAMGGIFIFILVRFFTFSPSPSEGFELRCGSEIKKVSTNLKHFNYQDFFFFISEAEGDAELTGKNMDVDPKLLSILHHYYSDVKLKDEDHWACTNRRTFQNQVKYEIPSKGFHNLEMEQILNSNGGELLALSMEVDEDAGSEDFFVVIELKESDERTIYSVAIPMKELFHASNQTAFSTGYLLPALEGGRFFKMYLWNNSSKTFTFSNFNANIIETKP